LVRAAVLEDPVWRWPTSATTSAANKQQLYEGWKSRLAYRKTLSVEESFIRGRRERPLWSSEDHDSDVPAKHQVAMQALDFILEDVATWQEQVVKFQSPVLLVYGNTNLGGIVGPDIAAEARRLNELVEPVQVPTAGHSIRRERFEDYLAVVREFLARIQRIQPVTLEAVHS
jgi:pimeloyl-ACP methyl ester carboxylesterase